MHAVWDRLKEQASTSGLTAFTLTGAVAGFLAFSDRLTTNGDTTFYAAVYNNEWEVGLGTRTSSTVLARTAVIASSNGDAAVNFTAAPVVYSTTPGPTVSALLRAPAFRAYQSSSQALASGTLTAINFQTENYDTHNAFASNQFTVPTGFPGLYHFKGSISENGFGNGLGGGATVTLYQNGTAVARGTQPFATTSIYLITVDDDVVCAVGDVLEIKANANNSISLAASSVATYFSGHYIRGMP